MSEPGAHMNMLLQHLSDGSCQTTDQMAEQIGLDRRQVCNGARKLILRGFAERIELGCYRIRPEGIKALSEGVVITSGPYDGNKSRKQRKANKVTLRQRAWNVMLMGDAFTIGDLLMATGDLWSDEGRATNNLQRYCRALACAGYLAVLPTRAKSTKRTSNGFKRYRLLKNTGPTAPTLKTKGRAIFDHNLGDTGEVVTCK